MVHFPFILLPEEQCQKHLHGIDTVHKKSRLFFLLVFIVFAALFFWFIGLQCWSNFALHKCYDKTLWEFIKVLVSSVCTVPNAKNTRRSTALGERNPSYLVFVPDTQHRLIPLWFFKSLLGVAVGAERKWASLCTQRHSSGTVLLHCTVQQTLLSSSLRNFPNSFRGTGGLEGIQSFEKGEKTKQKGSKGRVMVLEVPTSFKLVSATIQKRRKRN